MHVTCTVASRSLLANVDDLPNQKTFSNIQHDTVVSGRVIVYISVYFQIPFPVSLCRNAADCSCPLTGTLHRLLASHKYIRYYSSFEAHKGI